MNLCDSFPSYLYDVAVMFTEWLYCATWRDPCDLMVV